MVDQPETLSGVRVVIVSGDRECLQTAGLTLEVRGATVRCATSVEQGVAALDALQPHVVVCDLSSADSQFNLLPELAPEVRTGSATVALTTFGSRIATGFDFVLDRNHELAQLAELVDTVMKRRAGERGDTPGRDQPVPPEQEKPPVDEPPGEPGSPPSDPRPEGDPPKNEPTRLV